MLTFNDEVGGGQSPPVLPWAYLALRRKQYIAATLLLSMRTCLL
ncbi:hypothetical protein VPHD292_0024 [Vibrio phage D292]